MTSIRTSPPRRLALLLGCLLLSALLAGAAPTTNPAAEEEGSAPAVTIESIHVTPDQVGPETLCQLEVSLRNQGDRTVSQLAFDVSVAGHELPVYRNQIFMEPLPAGETTRIKLYNFWTTETGRPAPSGKKLEVEVSLREAQWYRIAPVEEDGETIEEWTPLGEIEALPQSLSIEIPFEGK